MSSYVRSYIYTYIYIYSYAAARAWTLRSPCPGAVATTAAANIGLAYLWQWPCVTRITYYRGRSHMAIASCVEAATYHQGP